MLSHFRNRISTSSQSSSPPPFNRRGPCHAAAPCNHSHAPSSAVARNIRVPIPTLHVTGDKTHTFVYTRMPIVSLSIPFRQSYGLFFPFLNVVVVVTPNPQSLYTHARTHASQPAMPTDRPSQGMASHSMHITKTAKSRVAINI